MCRWRFTKHFLNLGSFLNSHACENQTLASYLRQNVHLRSVIETCKRSRFKLIKGGVIKGGYCFMYQDYSYKNDVNKD